MRRLPRDVRRLLRGLPLVGVLLLTAIGLVGGVMLVLSTVQAQRGHRLQADRAAELIVLLRDLNRDATGAESAQRGYFISLNTRYLAPYRDAQQRYGQNLDRLSRLAAQTGDERQVRLAHEVGRLMRQTFAELDQSVAQVERGEIFAAQKQILTNEGQEGMERLRVATNAMERNELERLRAASALAQNSASDIVPQLIGLLAMVLLALLLGLWLIMRNADAEARAENAAMLSAARERAELLARELDHRVKNLFAVVLAIVQMTGRDSPEAKPVADTIAARIRALLKSHEVTTGAGAGGASLHALVDTVLAPYLDDGCACSVDGPELALPPEQATPVGLILHELVTNAVKYGALAGPGGRIAVRWQLLPGHPSRVQIDWTETCPGAIVVPDGKEGFGSFLLQGSIRQLGGEFDRKFRNDGHEIVLRFPLRASEPAGA